MVSSWLWSFTLLDSTLHTFFDQAQVLLDYRLMTVIYPSIALTVVFGLNLYIQLNPPKHIHKDITSFLICLTLGASAVMLTVLPSQVSLFPVVALSLLLVKSLGLFKLAVSRKVHLIFWVLTAYLLIYTVSDDLLQLSGVKSSLSFNTSTFVSASSGLLSWGYLLTDFILDEGTFSVKSCNFLENKQASALFNTFYNNYSILNFNETFNFIFVIALVAVLLCFLRTFLTD